MTKKAAKTTGVKGRFHSNSALNDVLVQIKEKAELEKQSFSTAEKKKFIRKISSSY